MQWSSVFEYMRAQKWVWLVCCQLGTKCFSVTHTGLSETTCTVVHKYFGFSSTKITEDLIEFKLGLLYLRKPYLNTNTNTNTQIHNYM